MLLPDSMRSFLRSIGMWASVLATLLGCFSPAGAQVQWNLVWSDEFNGPTNSLPDSNKWGYDSTNSGSGNQELQTYCGQAGGGGRTGICSNWPQNAHLDGQGNLII